MSPSSIMGPLTEASLPTVDVALFVHTSIVGAHVGVVYRARGAGGYRLLHQAWHYDSRDEALADGLAEAPAPIWWLQPALDEDERADLRTHAVLVASRMKERPIPYAFDAGDAAISADGVVNLGASLGLTCSSFVVLLFRSARVALLDQESWAKGRSPERRAEDERAHRRLVEYLRGADSPHAERVANDVTCTRIRAEEVAVCSSIDVRPVAYPDAEFVGRQLLSRIQAR